MSIASETEVGVRFYTKQFSFVGIAKARFFPDRDDASANSCVLPPRFHCAADRDGAMFGRESKTNKRGREKMRRTASAHETNEQRRHDVMC